MWIVMRSDRGGGSFRYWTGRGWEDNEHHAKRYLSLRAARCAKTVVERNTCLDLSIQELLLV